MKKSKLLQLLSQFDYLEHKKLDKFLRSPFFNEKEELVELCAHIRSVVGPKVENPNPELLQKEVAWVTLWPKIPYDDQQMRHYMSALFRLACKFLSIRNLEDNPTQSQLHLLRELREIAPGKVYESEWKKAASQLEKNKMEDDLHYYSNFLLESEWGLYMQQQNVRGQAPNLQKAVDHLDLSYFITKLKSACTLLNNQKVVDLDHRIVLLEEIREQILQSNYQQVPAISIYSLILNTLTNPEIEEHFINLKNELEIHAHRFTREEARGMYTFAMNYCIRMINKGETGYLEQLFEVYKNVLEHGIILENEQISPWDYKNIVVVALRLTEYEWAENFIRSYKQHIPEDFRENAYTYNLAKLHFYKREYSEVLKYLQKVEYEDVFYNLDSKVMLLKTYFDLEEVEALDSLIDSFRLFLRRNTTITDNHRRNYLNLIRFVKKLSRIHPGNRKKLAKLRTQIAETEQIADVNWLMEQIEKLDSFPV